MIAIFGLENFREKFTRPVLTIGNFDGVHLGHLALFDKVIERAGALGGTPSVLTFEPHPIRVLRPDVNLPLICVLDRRLELIEAAGMDLIVVAVFTPDFAGVPAEDFVEKILVRRFGLAELVVGHDYTFGRGAGGDIGLLKMMGGEHGFSVHEVGPVTRGGGVVSSTRIRRLIESGEIAAANELLGRQYQIVGRVIKGHRRGRDLGFPTANLRPKNELIPAMGVYACWVETDHGRFMGVTNIGTNPTFGQEELSVESHLLDFDADIYGETIRVNFVNRVRGQRRFSGPEELSSQIALDISESLRILLQSQNSQILAKK